MFFPIAHRPSPIVPFAMTNVPPANGGNEPPAPSLASSVMRGLMMFMFMNMAQKYAIQAGYMPDPNAAAAAAAANMDPANMDPAGAGAGAGTAPNAHIATMKPQGVGTMNRVTGIPSCVWKKHTALDLHIYITDSEELDPLTECLPPSPPDKRSKHVLSEWHETDLELAALDHTINSRTANITVPISKSVQYNETHLYAHVCLLKQDYESSSSSSLPETSVLHKTFMLTKHKKRKRIKDEKNLLSSENTTEQAVVIAKDASPLTKASADKKEDAILLYLKPTLTLQLIDLNSMPVFPERNKIPAQITNHMNWLNETSTQYYPLLYNSEFWITNEALVEVNDTIKESSIQITFENIKVWKWQLMSQMEETWRKQEEATGEQDAGTDMFRTMLLETNPILLAVTGVISVLHTVFDMLAFKNDIKFFKNKKSMVGISLRAMIINILFQIVILFYLLDNDTSFMILMSNGMGVAIEAWKISRAVKVSLFDSAGKMSFSWTETDTYKDSKTKEYDEIATDHLMFVTMPLVCGYGVYSLVHQTHKGWYSWILNTLVGFIYMFGFVMMTPQLFINYKLQSVAHLNWRTMTYKSINTFIDDLFGE